ncbi:MAG: hypothetical protein GWN55_06830, partial [Phycisphaerae bacterium]|nr:hypothetical protein [Phycisphaerae bacterium]NIV70474.1 hypothetical protein [Phycisphaerae bacterium]
MQRLAAAEKMEDREVTVPENWQEMAKEMDARVYAHLDSMKSETSKALQEQSIAAKLKSMLEKAFHLVFTPKLAYVALVVSMGLGAIYGYAFLNRSRYFGVAVIEAEKIGMLRGENIQSESLRRGLQFFEQEKYDQAIEPLGSYLENEPNPYQANYFLGLAYLLDARVHLLGVPYRFNPNKVSQGIKYLEKARSVAGENAFYREDCLWYLAKAYLMLDELEKARKPLKQL